MSDELVQIQKTVTEGFEKIEKSYATKEEVARLASALEDGKNEMRKQLKQGKKLQILGSEENAIDFAQSLYRSLEGVKDIKTQEALNHVKKSGVYSQTGTGSNFISLNVSEELMRAMREVGWAKQEHDVFYTQGLAGIPFNRGDASAAWVTDDSTAQGTDTLATIGRVTITPKTLLAIGRASQQAIFNNPLIGEMVARDLVEAAAFAEDTAVLFGTGTQGTSGLIKGYEAETVAGLVTVTSGATITYDNLCALKALVNPYEQKLGAFYLTPLAYAQVQAIKGTANDHPIFAPNLGLDRIAGRPVFMLPQDHNTSITSGDLLALYGTPRRCGKWAMNRQMSIDVDYSVDFTKCGIVWRLACDEAWAVVNTKAIAKMRYISTSN